MTNSEVSIQRPCKTKIVATIGPACDAHVKLLALIRAGVDVFRINTAHGGPADHQSRFDAVRRASAEARVPIAILVDLAGPKMRLNELPGGSLDLPANSAVRFVRGDRSDQPGDLTTTYEPLVDELQVGDRVLLADGTVMMVVQEKTADAAICRVVQGGTLRSRQGVNLPGVKLSAPALGQHDRQNALWAAKAGADFISLSFVRSAADVLQLKALIREARSDAQIVAKIEKPEAVADLEPIVQAADAVMVARGDLGVEIDIAEVPMVQKRIIRLCRRYRKPVIVATQMLDSMQRSRLPTRAEAADVANAILDGADACMLSGETAIGEYPVESVEMMQRIALSTEALTRNPCEPQGPATDKPDVDPITDATAHCAGHLAEILDARLIAVFSATGATARSLSQSRLFVPTVGISDSEAVLRRMCLYWGVAPLAGVQTDDPQQLLEIIIAEARRANYPLNPSDRIVLIGKSGPGAGRHNMVLVHEVGH